MRSAWVNQSKHRRTSWTHGCLRYCLRVGDVASVESSFRDDRLTVVLPTQIATQWASDETAVSIAGEHGPTSVLVEKDFECLDPRAGEDQSNRFRNPKAS